MKYLILLFLFTGCAATPIFQHKSAEGGRVLVLGSRSINNSSMLADSKALMLTHCAGAVIVAEGRLPMQSMTLIPRLEQYYDFECGVKE
jgi:hypothetical protein